MMSVQYMLAVCVVCVLLSGGLSYSCPCEDHALCQPITTTPKKEIFIFSTTKSSEVWMKYNWTAITTLTQMGTPDDQLMCYAHKQGVRIVAMVDFGPVSALANSTARQIWVKQQTQLVQQHYLDGVNIDFEKPILETEKSYRDGYTALVRETRESLKALNPYLQVTVDVAHTPNLYDRYYDYVGLSEASDFLFLMCYDEVAHVRIAGPQSAYKNTLEGILTYMSLPGISPSKLVLGAPWYGYDFTCSTIFPHNTCIELSETGLKRKQMIRPQVMKLPGAINNGVQKDYDAMMKMLKNSTTGKLWDQSSLTPYFTYPNTVDHKLHQVWYDDGQSLAEKFKLVNILKLRGGGMFRADILDYSDTAEGKKQRQEMWGAFNVINMD